MIRRLGGRHSSVVSSVPTILRPRVRIPSTPSMLFQFVLLKLYRENNENKQKEAGIGPIFKNNSAILEIFCFEKFVFITMPQPDLRLWV